MYLQWWSIHSLVPRPPPQRSTLAVEQHFSTASNCGVAWKWGSEVILSLSPLMSITRHHIPLFSSTPFSPYPPLPSPPLLHSCSSHRDHLSSPDHHLSPTGHAFHPPLQYHPPSRNSCHLLMETRWCLAWYQRGSSALCYQHFRRHHDWQCPGAWCRKIHMYSSNQGSIYRWQSDLPPRCLLHLQCHCHKWEVIVTIVG